MTLKSNKNLFEFDTGFKKKIIGTDEAGRGPAAGGVFAAAVTFPENYTEELTSYEKLGGYVAITYISSTGV